MTAVRKSQFESQFQMLWYILSSSSSSVIISYRYFCHQCCCCCCCCCYYYCYYRMFDFNIVGIWLLAVAHCLCIYRRTSHSTWNIKCTVKFSLSYIFSLCGYTVICFIDEYIRVQYCSNIVGRHLWVWSHILKICNATCSTQNNYVPLQMFVWNKCV